MARHHCSVASSRASSRRTTCIAGGRDSREDERCAMMGSFDAKKEKRKTVSNEG